MFEIYLHVTFHHSLRMMKPVTYQQRSGQLDVAHFRQVEDRRRFAFGILLRPLAVNLQAFDALGATQNVAVFYKPALADVGAVNTHDKPLLKIKRAS